MSSFPMPTKTQIQKAHDKVLLDLALWYQNVRGKMYNDTFTRQAAEWVDKWTEFNGAEYFASACDTWPETRIWLCLRLLAGHTSGRKEAIALLAKLLCDYADVVSQCPSEWFSKDIDNKVRAIVHTRIL